jgi:hypothetical protein
VFGADSEVYFSDNTPDTIYLPPSGAVRCGEGATSWTNTQDTSYNIKGPACACNSTFVEGSNTTCDSPFPVCNASTWDQDTCACVKVSCMDMLTQSVRFFYSPVGWRAALLSHAMNAQCWAGAGALFACLFVVVQCCGQQLQVFADSLANVLLEFVPCCAACAHVCCSVVLTPCPCFLLLCMCRGLSPV